jgi:hypothetical protein
MPAHDPKDNSDDERTIVDEATSQKTKTVATEMIEDSEPTRSAEPTVPLEPTLANLHVEDHGNIVPEVDRKLKAFPRKGINPALLTRTEAPEESGGKLKYFVYLLIGIAVIAAYSYNKKNSQLKALVQTYLNKGPQAQAGGTGTLRLVLSEPDAVVKINGQPVSLTEDQLSVQLGQNLQIRVEKEGFMPYVNIVQLKDMAPMVLTINLQPAINGKLFYSTIPPSTINLSIGSTELTNEFGEINNRMLAPGKYTVHVSNLNLGVDYVEEIEIQAGKFLRIEKNLGDGTRPKKP